MLGPLIGAMKGAFKKPKANPKSLIGNMGKEKGGNNIQPKKGMVPDAGGTTVARVVEVKTIPVDKISSTKLGSTPLALEFESIFYRTVDIHNALNKRSQAKKRLIANKNKAAEKKRRNLKERLSEMGRGLGNVPGVSAVGGAIGSLWNNIMKTLGILFAGWLMNYLPQILDFVTKFITIAEKIVQTAIKIITPFVKALWWITKKGTALFGMLVGVDPEEAQRNSFLKNVTEIQKKIPLIEYAFAAFAILKAKGKFTREKPGTGTTKPKPRVKTGPKKPLNKWQRGQRLRKLKAQRRLRDNTKKLNLLKRKTKIGALRKIPPGVRRGTKNVLTNIAKKADKIKGIASKIKIPIIGPLILAVTQIIAGEPLSKAIFMGVGAGLTGALVATFGAVGAFASGGTLAAFFPMLVMGAEGIGAFIGELLYEGFLGKGWGAAGAKLKNTFTGIFDQAGKMGKMVWDWVTKGGLWNLIKSIGLGAGKVLGWIFSPPGKGGLLDLLGTIGGGLLKAAKYILMPNGLLWHVIKGGAAVAKMLWNWFTGGGFISMLKGMGGGAGKVLGWLWNVAIPAALKAAGNAGKALLDWFKGGMGRFVSTFPGIQIPDTSIGEMMAGLAEKFLGGIIDWKIKPEVEVSVGEKDHDKPWYHWNRHLPEVGVKVDFLSLRDVLKKMTWNVQDILGNIFKLIPGLNMLVKDGKVKSIPDLSKLFWPPGFMLKHAMSSFFPGSGESSANPSGMTASSTGSTQQSQPSGLTTKQEDASAAGGITPTPDNSKSDDAVKGQGATAASADASSISESASYDKQGGGKGGIVPIPVGQMQGAGAGAGGKGNAIIQSSVNKYEVINGFKKTMILAELYKG